ncbi:MAG TPA: ABC transporter ATP-binding protein [Longimicrobiaceae bacterium]|nr:ABC transporter ATP-binding protein [Longimicrobiaceae bacterium]
MPPDPTPPDAPAAVVRMRGVHKRFGPVHANRGAELEVAAGEIHALVGENGAGKSTLMRILSGMYAPDEGTVEVFGKDVTGWSTAEAIAAGVGMVHQHFMLVPTLTVAENLVLGNEPTRGGRLDRERARREVAALSERTGLAVHPDHPVSRLSVGEAQRVEILKALHRGARVLVLDEPTAVLSPPEVAELWNVLRRLRGEGATVILITHRLDEVMAVTDTITVMRAGATVTRIRTAGTSPAEIARAMVGREVSLATLEGGEREGSPASPAAGAPVLEVRDLVVAAPGRPRAVDGVSFTVAAGEVLGIAGVEGNGQTELIEAIAGLAAVESGDVVLGGREIHALPVRARGEAGLSHIPEDRHRRGLLLEYTVADNLVLGQQHRFSRGAALDRGRIERNAGEQVRAYDVRPPDPSLPARALSGGNQQKVVVAREMGRDFRLLLAAQPTRGVDVGAVEMIHDQLRQARAAGKAILLVSAELNEVLALADRVAVMYAGRFAVVMPAAEASEEVLGPYMTGAAGRETATEEERS